MHGLLLEYSIHDNMQDKIYSFNFVSLEFIEWVLRIDYSPFNS